MTKRIAVLVLAATALAISAPAAEFSLERKQANFKQASAWGNGRHVSLSRTKPGQILKEPAAQSKRLIYAVFQFGADEKMAARFDQSEGNSGRYDTLILDLNGNGDLTDDPVHKRAQTPEKHAALNDHAIFGPIEMEGKTGGLVKSAIFVELYLYDARRAAGYIRSHSAVYLTTEVEVGGKKQLIGLYDGNCNFRLDYRGLAPNDRDTLLRDNDGSGSFAARRLEGESEPLGIFVFLGSDPYSLAISDDLKTLRIDPYEGKTGEIRFDPAANVKSVLMAFKTRSGETHTVVLPNTGKPLHPPVGDYQVEQYTVAAANDDGSGAQAVGFMREMRPAIAVKEGQVEQVKLGAPLKLEVNAEIRSNTELLISLKVVGIGGESYAGYHTTTGDNTIMPKPPKFKVEDMSGNELASGNLEFG